MSASEGSEDRTRLDGFEIEIFQLVKKQATSEQWREWLRAPLEHAAAKGDMGLFTRLMDAGADGSAGWRGCRGRTLLGAAAYGKNEKIVHALLGEGSKDDVNVVFNNVNRETALYVAAAQGAEEACTALMLAGADPNVGNSRMLTPLHMAVKRGQHAIVGNLLLNGADPKAIYPALGFTALHFAALLGHALCVPKLLLSGAEKDSRDTAERTALFLAASRNHLGVVEVLLAAGANPDIRHENGLSVLDVAARRGRLDVLRALLRHGVDARATHRGVTALHCAVRFEGSAARPADNGGVIRLLLEAGADIEAKTTPDRESPLHFAVNVKTLSTCNMRALLERGADVNSRDTASQTPLHRACHFLKGGRVKLLLQWGADETLVDEDGKTAEEVVGGWKDADDDDFDEDENQRVRHMLARAPADRRWRRRGWLVLCRSYPKKVHVGEHCSVDDSPVKVAKTSPDGSGGGGDEIGDEAIDLAKLLGRVVGLEGDGVFRLVVGFL